MKKGKRNKFYLYHDSWKLIKHLSYEQRGVLFTAIFGHELREDQGVDIGEKLPEMDALAEMAFEYIQDYLDENRKSWGAACEANRKNGEKGGRPRKEQKDPDPEKPNGFSENRMGFSKTRYDKDIETDKDKEIGKGNDIGKDNGTDSPPAGMQATASPNPDPEKPNGFGDIFKSLFDESIAPGSSQYSDVVVVETSSAHGNPPTLASFKGVPVRGEIWKPTEDQLHELEAAYPSVDVMEELERMREYALEQDEGELSTKNILKAVKTWMGYGYGKGRGGRPTQSGRGRATADEWEELARKIEAGENIEDGNVQNRGRRGRTATMEELEELSRKIEAGEEI